MAQLPNGASPWLSVREAADLLGLTPDAVRKRFASGRLDGEASGNVVRISATAVERQRADLLRRLNARDARGTQGASPAGDLPSTADERDRLRAELIAAKASAQALAQANAAALDMSRAQLDAIQQFLTPSGIDG